MGTNETPIHLMDVLQEDCIQTGASLTNKEGALQHIARLAAASPKLANISENDILDGLRTREELGSTGFGEGIAIPHCRLAGVTDFVVGMVCVPDGVAFDALDGEPVRLLVFIIAPQEGASLHIHLLSSISQALLIPNAVEEIVATTTAEAARESLLRHIRDEFEPQDTGGKNLIHVFVQDENLFREALQILHGLGAHSVAVMEAQVPSVYLSRMPLFAGLWTDDHREFSRVIVAVLRKKLTNEAIRRIERITGPLADCNNLMLTVQEIFYAAGSLEL